MNNYNVIVIVSCFSFETFRLLCCSLYLVV